MRLDPQLEACRFTHPVLGRGHDNNGFFRVYNKKSMRTFDVQSSDGGGWDHVSVSLPSRCPTWEEMCYIKSLFFAPDEWVVQYHPAESKYVNAHPHCLHLWRPQREKLPLPERWMVG